MPDTQADAASIHTSRTGGRSGAVIVNIGAELARDGVVNSQRPTELSRRMCGLLP